ncbi:uncharacterized protein LOC141857828 [Brevipalpus obovatus]|uniref:uncharacterized protein LOC141857828 n=1 Tax=Brevipalpus obovatus TaxID=246614 RepID=UPI003D9EBDA0
MITWFFVFCIYSLIEGSHTSEDSVTVSVDTPEPSNETKLSCYTCLTLLEPECLNVTAPNSTEKVQEFAKECGPQEKYCAVIKVEHETPDHLGTVFWSLERKCMQDCVPKCIVLSERLKMNHCRDCCSDDLCNIGSSSGLAFRSYFHLSLSSLVLNHLLIKSTKFS